VRGSVLGEPVRAACAWVCLADDADVDEFIDAVDGKQVVCLPSAQVDPDAALTVPADAASSATPAALPSMRRAVDAAMVGTVALEYALNPFVPLLPALLHEPEPASHAADEPEAAQAAGAGTGLSEAAVLSWLSDPDVQAFAESHSQLTQTAPAQHMSMFAVNRHSDLAPVGTAAALFSVAREQQQQQQQQRGLDARIQAAQELAQAFGPGVVSSRELMDVGLGDQHLMTMLRDAARCRAGAGARSAAGGAVSLVLAEEQRGVAAAEAE
jgi:hypothetical protein